MIPQLLKMKRTIITGSGSYIPENIRKNEDFAQIEFYNEEQQLIKKNVNQIIEDFRKITGIEERRYADPGLNASGMALLAAKIAIEESGINQESLDQIIVAHNYGDLAESSLQPDTVPALASRIKHGLGIRNPNCVAYDILFGCPGWLQGLIQADSFLKSGMAEKCLVIGTETLSRILDPFDRDSMIFADGAGACVVEQQEGTSNGKGILSASSRSDCMDEAFYIYLGNSYSPNEQHHGGHIKMKGRKVYEYAVRHVPAAMKECLDKSGASIGDLKKIFIHQANEKMDESILKAFYHLYDIQELPENIMPMSIHWLGNSSVATIPTLFDLVRKGQITDHHLNDGDLIMFASVGAGMNINAVCYRY